jgi:hypothetical protein
MFEQIEQYMLKSKEERTSHIRLEERCIEIGGVDSTEYRGLLAHTLKTTIPTGKKVVCAHACNNHICSNPNHLYWGTYAENFDDAVKSGRYKSGWFYLVQKHGLEKAKLMAAERGRQGGLVGGKKTAETVRLSEAELDRWREVLDRVDIDKFGWISKAQKELGCSHTWIRKVTNKYFTDLNFHTRKTK